MAIPPLGSSALLALGLVIAGCAAEGSGPIEPKLASEGECYVAPDPVRCRIGHDKAGGYGMEVVGTDR